MCTWVKIGAHWFRETVGLTGRSGGVCCAAVSLQLMVVEGVKQLLWSE